MESYVITLYKEAYLSVNQSKTMPRPYKKRTFKRRKPSFKKRRYGAIAKSRNRRLRSAKRTTYLPRGIVAKRSVVRLPYCTNATATSTTGSIANYTFRANDLYDPDFTSTGHQPLGFDQVCPTMYNHFTVVSSRIVVIADLEPTVTVPVLIAIQKASGTSWTPTAPSEIMETPHLFYKIIPVGNGNSRRVLKSSMNMKKFFGVRAIVGESSYKGSYNASPSEQSFFRIWVHALGGGSATAKLTVRLTYTAVFTEPVPISQS